MSLLLHMFKTVYVFGENAILMISLLRMIYSLFRFFWTFHICNQ